MGSQYTANVFLRRKLRPLLREVSYYTSFPLIRPLNVFLDVTDRCQLRCTTCTKWTTPDNIKEKELALDEWKRILVKLKHWLGSYTCFFCGGEPFLREDLLELINFAAQHHIYSSVITNGYEIDHLTEKIVHSRLASLHVSLNGITPDIHDATRGIPGSFEKAMRTILKINQLRHQSQGEKLWLNIATILMPENAREIIPLVEWVEKSCLDSISFQMLDDKISFHAFSKLKGIQDTENYHIPQALLRKWKDSQSSLTQLLDMLIHKKQKGKPIANSEDQLQAMKMYVQNPIDILQIQCRVGISNFAIDAYGNVRLCFNMLPIGSIRSTDPKQLWYSIGAYRQRTKIKHCSMLCRLLSCNFP